MSVTTDFRAVPIKFLEDSFTSHFVYIKKHNVRENNTSRPTNRTLFIVNIPPFCNEIILKEMLCVLGEIESLQLNDKPSSGEQSNDNKRTSCVQFKVCYVVFKYESGLQSALKLNELRCSRESLKKYNGINKWIRQYNTSIPNIEKMKNSVTQFIAAYDIELKKKTQEEKSLGEADEEGWITVTKQGRKAGFTRSENVTNKIMSNKNKQQKKKELKNFYTFQIRESKMNHIIALRHKFEEDKKKIIALKQSRRFKPF